MISYGDNREHLLILSVRPKTQKAKACYMLNFAQCVPTLNSSTSTIQQRKNWNSHVLMSQVLTERFIRNTDLISLIKYLSNTWKSLEAIYNFGKMRLHSQKALTQILMIEANFPVELRVVIFL